MKLAECSGMSPAAQPVFLLCEHHYRPAFRRLVGETRQLRGIRQFFVGHAGNGQKLHRLPIAQSDGSGLIEQQRVHVAGRFHRFAAHGQHVVLHHAIHTCDSDG